MLQLNLPKYKPGKQLTLKDYNKVLQHHTLLTVDGIPVRITTKGSNHQLVVRDRAGHEVLFHVTELYWAIRIK